MNKQNTEAEAATSNLKVMQANLELARSNLETISNLLEKRKEQHLTNWREWDSYNVVSWICRLNNGTFAKYKGFWREAFEQQKVTGKMLPKLDVSTLKDLGITVL